MGHEKGWYDKEDAADQALLREMEKAYGPLLPGEKTCVISHGPGKPCDQPGRFLVDLGGGALVTMCMADRDTFLRKGWSLDVPCPHCSS